MVINMKRFIVNACVLLLAAVLFNSCEKAELKDGGGTSLVKFFGGGTDPVSIALDLDPPTETIKVLDVRREAASSADNNTPAVITFTNSQAFLDAYNEEHDTEFELLPANSYTVTPESGVTMSGDTWTVTLAAGEPGRTIYVTLDKSKLDLAKSYAYGVEITSTTVGAPSVELGSSVVNVLIKNSWDGAYEVTGTMVDAANGALVGDFPIDYHLVTRGASRVAGYSPDTENFTIPIINSADNTGSQYGTFGPIFNYDANDNITSVTNFFGQPAANGRYAQLDPSGINKRDADGNIDVKFFMFQPSSVPLPAPRVSFSWHLEYQGPR